MERRIIIIGTSCSGKSTLAKTLSNKLGIVHYELDHYFWKEHWTESTKEEFTKKVKDIIEEKNWVICGNYSKVREIIWSKATDIIWLDYPFQLVLFRSIKRSFIRSLKKEKVCNGNIETFKQSFFSKESIILWVIKTYKRRKNEYPILLKEFDNKRIFRLRNKSETNKYIESELCNDEKTNKISKKLYNK
jgi:adenylate kinase family enzyme